MVNTSWHSPTQSSMATTDSLPVSAFSNAKSWLSAIKSAISKQPRLRLGARRWQGLRHARNISGNPSLNSTATSAITQADHIVLHRPVPSLYATCVSYHTKWVTHIYKHGRKPCYGYYS